jgi:hypothetical protein
MSYLGVNLPLVARCWTGSCDSQWHTAPGFAVALEFVFTSNQSRRGVWSTTSRAAQVLGQTTCHYGPVTGYGCGNLQSKSFQPSWVPNANFVFMKAENCSVDLSEPGDSGGPNFFGNAALGITSGNWHDLTCGGLNKMIYNAIDDAANPFGVSALIAPH